MKFDDIDISIIFYLFDNKDQTTSDIAKNIFESEPSKDPRNQEALTRFRLKNLEKLNIIMCSPTIPKTYNTNREFVFCGEGTLDIKVNGGKKIEIEFGHFLVVTDGKEYIHVNRILKNGETDKIVKLVA